MRTIIARPDSGLRVLELTAFGWAVTAGVVLVALVLVVLRRVRPGTWLVLLHAGRVVAIHRRGLALVVPRWHRAVSVAMRAERIEVWVNARTRDAVAVRIGLTAQAVTVDPGAYARHGGPESATDDHIESIVRQQIAELDLAELLPTAAAVFGKLDDLVSAATRAFGIEVTGFEATAVETVLLPGPNHIEPAQGGARGMDIEPAAVPGTGTVHHCDTRGGQQLGLLVEHGGNRRLFVYGSTDFDVPAQTIVLEGDEADQLADLLQSRSVADRLAALEHRMQQLADQPGRNA